jgi:hypothetical protein
MPDDKDSAPQCPVGFNPQETFTERDEARNVKNCVGIQIMELNPVSKKKATKERMRGKRQTPQKEGNEDYPEPRGRPGNDLRAGGERLRRRVLQKAHLLSLGQFLVPGLGLDPAADDGGVGIPSLGLLGGGAGGGGSPLAHGLGAQQKLWKWAQAEEATAVGCKEEDGGGGVRWTVHPAAVIYFFSGNLHRILAVQCEVETAEQIQPSTCQYRRSCGVHYAR